MLPSTSTGFWDHSQTQLGKGGGCWCKWKIIANIFCSNSAPPPCDMKIRRVNPHRKSFKLNFYCTGTLWCYSHSPWRFLTSANKCLWTILYLSYFREGGTLVFQDISSRTGSVSPRSWLRSCSQSACRPASALACEPRGVSPGLNMIGLDLRALIQGKSSS